MKARSRIDRILIAVWHGLAAFSQSLKLRRRIAAAFNVFLILFVQFALLPIYFVLALGIAILLTPLWTSLDVVQNAEGVLGIVLIFGLFALALFVSMFLATILTVIVGVPLFGFLTTTNEVAMNFQDIRRALDQTHEGHWRPAKSLSPAREPTDARRDESPGYGPAEAPG